MRKLSSFSLASVLLASLVPAAHGQEPQTASAGAAQEAVISYTPADFAAARPNTAGEMIARLPGFTLEAGEQVRGFAGAAGNVLIDGQRPTVKTDSLSEVLGRIPIAQVERIDLIRGGAPGIDMQGRTVVANVIRKRADSFQQVLTASSFLFTETGKTIPGWNYQATRRSGDHQFDFQLGRGMSMDDSVGFGSRTILDVPTGNLLSQRATNEGDGASHTARANYKGPLFGGTFSANGLIGTDEFKSEQRFYNATSNDYFVDRNANDRGEIGLNYKRDLTEQLEIETLFLSKLAIGTGDSTGTTLASNSALRVEAEAGETIGRTVLRYDHSPALSFEGGGELAFNFREQQIALTLDGASIPLPASDVRVEELRGEGFLQGSWRPRPWFSLETGVRMEKSTITQSGDSDRERSFVYTKPRLLMTWSPTKNEQVRARIEREVGQLNFRDFISNVDLNTNVLNAGNAELEPDKTWVYELALEKRFWDTGAAVLTLRHKDITDVVDQYPFLVLSDANGDGIPDDLDGDGQPDQRLVSGPGNIGDGKNDMLEFSLTLPLARLGLEGGELKVNSLFQNGEVRDPLTGELRRITSQRPDDIKVSFRQDLPEQKLTFGLGWYAGWSERRFLLREVQTVSLRNFWNSFVEYKPAPNFTLRAELNNFDPYTLTIERRVFDGPRGTGDLAMIETQTRNSQVIGFLRARWTFG